MLLLESENIYWWRPSWNLQPYLIYICEWILLVLNLIYGYTIIRIFRIIKLCTQLAATAISHKIMNNCCHLGFWRPYLISKTCFLTFYYFLQSHRLLCTVLCFAKKVYKLQIRYKMRYWWPFWIFHYNIFPKNAKVAHSGFSIMYTLKNMKHQ